MTSKEKYEKYKGFNIFFNGDAESCEISAIVIGYNEHDVIMSVTYGEGDYELKDSDVIPNTYDRIDNELGFIANDLDYVEFDY